MKVSNIRLPLDPNNSFIYLLETNRFAKWHHHPEYELVMVVKGKGRRLIGDYVDRFEEHDLILIGPYTPHVWMCDPEYFDENGRFLGQAVVIQFLPDFLGEKFFDIPEHESLNKILAKSSRGIQFLGEAKQRIIELMLGMAEMNSTNRLYSLFAIFQILTSASQFNVLASNAFLNQIKPDEHNPMQKALQYIMMNFQKQIYLEDLLEITNMSYSSFYVSFKNTYRMTFKEFLLNVRVGYACKLLTGPGHNISETAYLCGFENISNFNRQFKHIKGITPSEFYKKVREKRNEYY
jgi:AraC-like DNA-binding protein